MKEKMIEQKQDAESKLLQKMNELQDRDYKILDLQE